MPAALPPDAEVSAVVHSSLASEALAASQEMVDRVQFREPWPAPAEQVVSVHAALKRLGVSRVGKAPPRCLLTRVRSQLGSIAEPLSRSWP